MGKQRHEDGSLGMKTVLYFRLQWRLCQRHADGVFRYARKAGWKVRLIDAGRNTPTARP